MSAAMTYSPFDTQLFLNRVDQAASRREVLQLLRELELHYASLGAGSCQSFSEEAASRLSHRFTQVN
jgi:hypothetical protein